MALTSVSVYELSRLSSFPPPANTVRRRSNSTKVRRKDESVDRRRKSQNNEQVTISYFGRPRSPSHDPIRQRRASPVIKKVPSTSSMAQTDKKPGILKKDFDSRSSGDLWIECIDTVNEIGRIAKKDTRNIRRLKMATSRRIKLGDDEDLVLTATRFLSRCNGWSLDTCHDYLPIIIDNIISTDVHNRLIALEGIAAISDNLLEKLVKFATVPTQRIGVDVAAEERAEKAKACLQNLRSVVKKRDWYYRQLDEESIDKLDATMERLKKI